MLRAAGLDPARKARILLAHATPRIHHKQHHIRPPNGALSVLQHAGLHAAASATAPPPPPRLQPPSVQHSELQQAQGASALLPVPRGAWLGVHNGQAGAHQAVEQGGLAHIGAPHQRQCQGPQGIARQARGQLGGRGGGSCSCCSGTGSLLGGRAGKGTQPQGRRAQQQRHAVAAKKGHLKEWQKKLGVIGKKKIPPPVGTKRNIMMLYKRRCDIAAQLCRTL